MANYPLFDSVSSRELRALMTIFLGSGVYPKVMEGVGANILEYIIQTEYPKFLERAERCLDASLYAYLKKYLYTKIDGFSHDVVQSYIQALTCKPTNMKPLTLGDDDGKNPARLYKLPKYLEEFAGPDTEIYDGPKIGVRKGVGNCSHQFLAADGFKHCKGCNDAVCKFCCNDAGVDKAGIDKAYCLTCYAQETLIPMPGEGAGKPVNNMRDELFKKYILTVLINLPWKK